MICTKNRIKRLQKSAAAFEKMAWRNETLLRLMMEHMLLKHETAGMMHKKFLSEGRSGLADALFEYLERTQRV